MNRSGWVVHKRAFVTLGHESLASACLGVGHKGMVQSSPFGGRGMHETYSYIRPRFPGIVLGLYPGRLCRLGVRPGTDVHLPPYQGGF